MDLSYVSQKCPDIQPEYCFKKMTPDEQCITQNIDGIPVVCFKCWGRSHYGECKDL